jgi:hypothetical protein
MRPAVRCHGFSERGHATKYYPLAPGVGGEGGVRGQLRFRLDEPKPRQPKGVAARIVTSFVARLANTGSIGCTSLRAIANSGSQRTRVSSCYGLPEGAALSTELRGELESARKPWSDPLIPLLELSPRCEKDVHN